ncbi:TPA: 2-oxo acid dehydrogenase subunit E2 [Streptococcus pneumoniae]|nr:2-oxo acid dehydrogenase subunit E2 [Streptococcus pneumoniae]
MAVGMDNGLMTPVVYNAEKMSLSELVVAFKDVIGRTLDGKLAPSELQNSTFTISNLGMFGVQSFGPIINQPNSAILFFYKFSDFFIPLDDLSFCHIHAGFWHNYF